MSESPLQETNRSVLSEVVHTTSNNTIISVVGGGGGVGDSQRS